MKYPKINTIWKRDEKNRFNIIEGDFSCPEFDAIKQWHISEKIDGTNIRVNYSYDRKITFGGRTDDAQIPAFLFEFLQDKFRQETMDLAFKEPPTEKIILFGEGYGNKIRSAGKKYRDDCSFILFDVWIDGWWLEREKVDEIAKKLELDTVPDLGIMTTQEAIDFAKSATKSKIAQQELIAEGIVARSHPLMLFRNGEPIFWKLKVKDYTMLKASPKTIA